MCSKQQSFRTGFNAKRRFVVQRMIELFLQDANLMSCPKYCQTQITPVSSKYAALEPCAKRQRKPLGHRLKGRNDAEMSQVSLVSTSPSRHGSGLVVAQSFANVFGPPRHMLQTIRVRVRRVSNAIMKSDFFLFLPGLCWRSSTR